MHTQLGTPGDGFAAPELGRWAAKESKVSRRIVTALALIAIASGCSRPEQGSSTMSQEQRARSAALFDKAEKAQDETHKRNAELMERTDALLSTQEAMLKRQQEDFSRFEKILDIWEKQQAQYQRYLDTLPEKR